METNEVNNVLVMKFDPSTIEHLGIQMYATLPPVIAELVSNAYDADAKTVEVHLNDKGEKSIQVIDTGHGMDFNDINTKFLKIGRNRRKDEQKQLTNQKTESGNRFAIGKKGLGKLSFFGIAKTVTVETIRNGIKNIFKLEWEQIVNSEEPYQPEILEKDKNTQESNGTKITLTNIQRKTGFDPENIAYNLAKTFNIFNESDFETKILHNEEDECVVKNEMKFKNITSEFEWSFPLDRELGYEYAKQIKGKIISGVDTVPANMKGIALFSRGKLVNDHEFYDNTASSFGYAYITGFLDVSFIDNWQKDVISTNRKSLNWEDEDAQKLRVYLNEIVKYIHNDRKTKKKEKQVQEIEKIAGIQLDEWYRQLPKHECGLARKMTDSILNSEGITTSKQAELVKYVKDSFQFEAFKELANELRDDNATTEQVITLFKEWEIIEARELYKISQVRIETIKKFKSHIDNNSKEVPVLHSFFKQFSWILDPRIMNFKDEVTYSQLLKDKFTDISLPEQDRRIDFLCQNFGGIFYIIELKRPATVLGQKEILQALDYVSFIKERLGNEYGTNICCYLVGERLANTDVVKTLADSLRNDSKVFVRPYSELLANAEKYHQEFIDKYAEMKNNIGNV